jgi:ATP-binding cassette subfamily B multidrug efflux pump
MSQANEQKNDQKKKPIRQGFGGGRGGVGAPIEKPRNFMGSLKRLLGYLKPQLIPLIIVIVFAVVSTIFMIIAPKMLGKATNVLFEGIIGKMMPPNMTKDQAIEFLKFSGRDQIAQMLGPMNIVPGQGVNFSRLATILLTLLGVYALSAFFNWLQQYLMAGVAQKTVYNLRKEVDEKLARLPLTFFKSL